MNSFGHGKLAAVRVSLLSLVALLAASVARADVPAVVVSIKPLHSLIFGVMEGVGEPHLLIEGAGSPHTYALRPSDARALQSATLVFWVGEGLENFLVKPLAALPRHARVVALAEHVALLDARSGGEWEPHDHDHDHGHATAPGDDHRHGKSAGHGHSHHEKADAKKHGHRHTHGHSHGHSHGHDVSAKDLHIWLDPERARAIVDVAATELAGLDPSNANVYRRNAAALGERLDILDGKLREMTEALRGAPYVVFHDAYQYFERRYGMAAVGSVTVSPERIPGAKRLHEIRARIVSLGARCVFAEPQFEPALVNTVTEGTPARTGTLDPLGVGLPRGKDAYFRLMENLAGALGECLSQPT